MHVFSIILSNQYIHTVVHTTRTGPVVRTPALYSGGVHLLSRPEDQLPHRVSPSSSLPPGKCLNSTLITSQPLPSVSFSILYSFTILPFGAVYSELLRASLNKPQITTNH
jgi:hypothetical protein